MTPEHVCVFACVLTKDSCGRCGARLPQHEPLMNTEEHELTEFQRKVYEAVRQIPANETRTYGQVASAIGKPKAGRAVGTALAKNPWHHAACHSSNPTMMEGADYLQTDKRYVPCHRVVAANPKKRDVAYLGRSNETSICLKYSLREMDKLQYEDDHAPFLIYVKSARHMQTVKVTVSNAMTVDTLKTKVAELLSGVPVEEMRLVHRRRVLENGRTLGRGYSVAAEHTILLE